MKCFFKTLSILVLLFHLASTLCCMVLLLRIHMRFYWSCMFLFKHDIVYSKIKQSNFYINSDIINTNVSPGFGL